MSTLKEWTDKWAAFRAKVVARVTGIADEAAAAYAQVAEANPLDPMPVAQIDMALQSRMNGLSDKVDEAFAQIEEGVDALIDDARPRQLPPLTAARDRLHADRAQLIADMDKAETRCRVQSASAIARVLKQRFDAEDPLQTCVQCSTPFHPGPVYQSTSVSCEGCGSRMTVGPHPAALQWYSRGPVALAEDKALDLHEAYKVAERRYGALRHPTLSDYLALERAYRAYNEAHFAELVRLHPAWEATRAAEQVTGRCSQLRTIHRGRRTTPAEATTEGLQLARTSNPATLARWAAGQAPSPTSRSKLLDELLEAAVDQADRPAAATLVCLLHEDEMPKWFGRKQWVQTRLRALHPDFA